MLRRGLIALAITGASLIAGAVATTATAGAATTCVFTSGIVDVTMDGEGDVARLLVAGTSILVRDRNGATVSCPGAGGPPSVTNTDTVAITDNSDEVPVPGPNDGSTTAVIQAPEQFSPGKTQENGNDLFSEIEFAINLNDGRTDTFAAEGTGAADRWVLGTGGFNWNPTSGDPSQDADLAVFSPFDRHIFDLSGGANTFNARGGFGTGAPFDGNFLIVNGGPGSDVIDGGDGRAEHLHGAAGDDTLHGFGGGRDDLFPEAGDDTVNGGDGADTVRYDTALAPVNVDLGINTPQSTGEGTDTISQTEGVEGSPNADTLAGDAGDNQLGGRGGDDALEGRGGNDELDGSAGTDTVTYAGAPAAVTVDLIGESATGGDGTDRLISTDNVIGSEFADSLTGNEQPNVLTGLGGDDTLVGLAGADTLLARDGGPDTVTCGADADTVTADQRSVDRVASDCETADFLPEPPPPPAAPPAEGGGAGAAGGGGAAAEVPAGNAGAAAAAVDRVVALALRGARAQRVLKQKGVIVRLQCDGERCTTTAKATGKAGRTRLSKQKTTRLGADATKQVKLRLTRAQLAAIRRALAAGKAPTLKVTVEATDTAGNTTTETLKVKVKR